MIMSGSTGRVELIDTGRNTNTGGRLKRLAPFLGNTSFMVVYGDGVTNLSIVDLHRAHGKLTTLTAVRPRSRRPVDRSNALSFC